MNLGDFAKGDTVRGTFPTFNKSNASVTFTGGTLTVIRQSDGTVMTVTGLTLTKDSPATGQHRFAVDSSAIANIVEGDDYKVEIAAATVDAETVNLDVGFFSMKNRWTSTDRRTGLEAEGQLDTATGQTITNIVLPAGAFGLVAGHGGFISMHVTGGTGEGQTVGIRVVSGVNLTPDPDLSTALNATSTVFFYPVQAAAETALPTSNAIVTSVSNPYGIKKNTAGRLVFTMKQSADPKLPVTGITPTVERSIDGAAYGAAANAVTEISDGTYTLVLDAADTNGDVVAFKFVGTGAVQREIIVHTGA